MPQRTPSTGNHQAFVVKKGRSVASPGNALVKLFRRALAEGTTREGWLAVEGPLLLEEVIKASLQRPGPQRSSSGRSERAGETRAFERPRVQSVLASNSAMRKYATLLDRLPPEAELTEVPDRVFAGIAQTETPQGIAALVELPRHDLDAILARRDTLIVIACGVQDPGNLGTIMRSVEALGGSALLTLHATVSPYNPKAVRSSAGAIFRLPVFRGLDANDLTPRLRAARVTIAAADRHRGQSLAEADLRGPVAFLIGQEAAGLPAALARQADVQLSIPLRAEVDSLNAATAAAILLYEAARQRGFGF